jgi:hypothetical protein
MLDKKVLPRICAAALALAASLAAMPTASAAQVSQHYQAMAEISCGNNCTATFPQLAANRMLDIDHISCEVGASGNITLASFGLLPPAAPFVYALPLQWQRRSGATKIYTFGGDVNIRIPFGKRGSVIVLGDAEPEGTCAITGTLYINN